MHRSFAIILALCLTAVSLANAETREAVAAARAACLQKKLAIREERKQRTMPIFAQLAPLEAQKKALETQLKQLTSEQQKTGHSDPSSATGGTIGLEERRAQLMEAIQGLMPQIQALHDQKMLIYRELKVKEDAWVVECADHLDVGQSSIYRMRQRGKLGQQKKASGDNAGQSAGGGRQRTSGP